MTALMGPLPMGFIVVPAGVFAAGALTGTHVGEFTMKEEPVTNEEWGETVVALDEDTYILLDHDWETGEMRLNNKGNDIASALKYPVSEANLQSLQTIKFDLGEVAMLGGQILLKMVGNPSAQYDDKENGRIFSGARQPVVGVSWFHAKAWCILETIKSAGKWLYDLPTDKQFEYVASAKGTKEYGTSTGRLYGPDGKKLVHIDEWKNGKGTTVAVDDARYEPAAKRPFGIDAVGNVWRWTNFDAAFKQMYQYLLGIGFGVRAGSWGDDGGGGRAVTRFYSRPRYYYNRVGFSPVAVRQDSSRSADRE